MTELTPYAVLMARPVDTDYCIRTLYHALARQCHPDSVTPDVPRFYEVTMAYAAVKTAQARAVLARAVNLAAGGCTACHATGVQGYKVRLCSQCHGTGRSK